MTSARFENFTIVLQKPKFPGNIGSVARCIKNMGMGKLVVSEAGPFEQEEMKIMSTHFAADIIDNIKYYDHLGDALAPFRLSARIHQEARQSLGTIYKIRL